MAVELDLVQYEPGDLKRYIWEFQLAASFSIARLDGLRLQSYRVERRETKRHKKWHVIEIFSRGLQNTKGPASRMYHGQWLWANQIILYENVPYLDMAFKTIKRRIADELELVGPGKS